MRRSTARIAGLLPAVLVLGCSGGVRRAPARAVPVDGSDGATPRPRAETPLPEPPAAPPAPVAAEDASPPAAPVDAPPLPASASDARAPADGAATRDATTVSARDLAPDVTDAAPASAAVTTRMGARHVWVRVPAGTFAMGSAPNRPCREGWGDRETVHTVTLTRPFEISTHEVTQAQFQAAMGYDPSARAGCAQCPVESVTWSQAAAYCNALSVAESGAALPACYACTGTGRAVGCTQAAAYAGGKIYDCPGYRLPTEAEFEYAYRAGTTTDFYNGDIVNPTCSGSTTTGDRNADEIAVHLATSGDRTAPVGTKKPNAWGLHDMAGNVWNLCNDWYSRDLGAAAATDPWGPPGPVPQGHIVRGGSYHYDHSRQRAAQRSMLPATSPATGFRCVRTAGM